MSTHKCDVRCRLLVYQKGFLPSGCPKLERASSLSMPERTAPRAKWSFGAFIENGCRLQKPILCSEADRSAIGATYNMHLYVYTFCAIPSATWAGVIRDACSKARAADWAATLSSKADLTMTHSVIQFSHNNICKLTANWSRPQLKFERKTIRCQHNLTNTG